MGRMGGIKWDRCYTIRPMHNIISSDFAKYNPQPWKFMEGPPRIDFLLSYEYQRIWIEERDLWQKRMYPETTTAKVDVITKYIMSFKNAPPKPKKVTKEPFTMKKFQNIKAKTSNKRSSDDKAMKKPL